MSKIKILFIGDIVGNIGREIVKKVLPDLKKEIQPDIIIANAENLAGGKGVTVKTINEMSRAGVDLFTSGNHVWDTSEGKQVLIGKSPIVLRPANYPPMVSGVGFKEVKIEEVSFYVLNLMGRVFIKENLDCPFRVGDAILEEIKQKDEKAIILIDFHAEATSEKIAIKYYFDSRVSAIMGTHTHVVTADEQITAKGTAYITDAGAVLAQDSVIGVKKEEVLSNFLTQISEKFEVPKKGLGEFNSVYLEIDANSRKATKIKRIKKEVLI